MNRKQDFPPSKERIIFQHGVAWMLLCLFFAIHVTDEIFIDFLEVYNPIASTIRDKIPYLLIPIFTFKAWFGGLIIAIFSMFLLTPFVFRGAKWIKPLSYSFGIIMLVNGLLHIAGSFIMGCLMPGVYSSPLLLGGSVYILPKLSDWLLAIGF